MGADDGLGVARGEFSGIGGKTAVNWRYFSKSPGIINVPEKRAVLLRPTRFPSALCVYLIVSETIDFH